MFPEYLFEMLATHICRMSMESIVSGFLIHLVRRRIAANTAFLVVAMFCDGVGDTYAAGKNRWALHVVESADDHFGVSLFFVIDKISAYLQSGIEVEIVVEYEPVAFDGECPPFHRHVSIAVRVDFHPQFEKFLFQIFDFRTQFLPCHSVVFGQTERHQSHFAIPLSFDF